MTYAPGFIARRRASDSRLVVSFVRGMCSVMMSALASSSSSVFSGTLPLPAADARQERIVGGDFHADALRLARDGAADAAQADHAELLAFQLEAGEAGLRPFARPSCRHRRAGCGARARTAARSRVRPRRACCRRARSSPRCRARWRLRRRSCRRRRRRGRSRAAACAVFDAPRPGTGVAERTSKASTSASAAASSSGSLIGSETATSQPAIAEQGQTVFVDAIAGQHFHSHAPVGEGSADSLCSRRNGMRRRRACAAVGRNHSACRKTGPAGMGIRDEGSLHALPSTEQPP